MLPSNALLITACYDHNIRFWDPTSGRAIRSCMFQESQINCLAVSPDRTRLAVGGYNMLRLYDIGSAAQCPPAFANYEPDTFIGNITAVGFLPLRVLSENSVSSASADNNNNSGSSSSNNNNNNNGKLAWMYICSEDGILRLLDPRAPQTVRFLHKFGAQGSPAINCATLSANYQLLFAGTQTGKVVVWHVPSLLHETILVLKKKGQQQGISSSGSSGAAGSGSVVAPLSGLPPIPNATEAQFMFSPQGRPLQELFLMNDRSAVRSITVAPLVNWIAVATNHGNVHCLQLAKTSTTQRVGPNVSSSSTAAAAGGNPLSKSTAEEQNATATTALDTLSFSTSTQPLLTNSATTPTRPTVTLQDAAFTSDADINSSSNNNNNSSIVPSTTSKSKPNGGAAASSSSTSHHHHSSIPSPLQIQYQLVAVHQFPAHLKYVLKAAISPDGTLLATCSADYTIGLWAVPQALQRHREVEELGITPTPSTTTTGGAVPGELRSPMSDGSGTREGSPQTQPNSAFSSPSGGAFSLNKTPSFRLTPATPSTAAANHHGGEAGAAAQQLSLGANAAQQQQQQAGLPGSPVPVVPTNNNNNPSSPLRFPSLENHAAGASSNATDTNNNNSNNTATMNNTAKPSYEFKPLRSLTGHTRWVWDCAFLPCNTALVSVSSDASLKYWSNLPSAGSASLLSGSSNAAGAEDPATASASASATSSVKCDSFTGHQKPANVVLLDYELPKAMKI